MNYKQFEDNDDGIRSVQFSQKIDLQELQLIIDLTQLQGFDIFQSIYVIYSKGFRTTQEAATYLQHNEIHRYVEQTIDTCGVCNKNRQFHTIFEEEDKQLVAKINQIKDNLCENQQCCVCYMIFLDKDLLYLNNQKHIICVNCFIKYLIQEIENRKINDLKCPHCNIQIMDKDILQYSQELYTKYIQCHRNLEIAVNPNKAWCPTINCNTVLEFTQQQTISTCVYCNVEVCKGCKQEAHPHLSCEENLQQILNGWQEDRETQQCPRCKIIIEKKSGCNHMRCQFCKHEWCWICRSDYTSIHYAIFNPFGCPALWPGSRKQKNFSKVKLLMWRLICFILLIILAPIAVTLSAPFYSVANLIQSRCFQQQNYFIQTFLLIFTLAAGIALIPIAIVIFVVAFFPGIIGLIAFYYYDRKRLEIQHQTALSKHIQLNS